MRRRMIGVLLAVMVLVGAGVLAAAALAEDAAQTEKGSRLPGWDEIAAKVGLEGEAAALTGEDLGRALGLAHIVMEPGVVYSDCPGMFVEYRDGAGFCLDPVLPKLSFAEEEILASRIQGHVMTEEEIAKLIENLGTLGPDTVAEVGPLLP